MENKQLRPHAPVHSTQPAKSFAASSQGVQADPRQQQEGSLALGCRMCDAVPQFPPARSFCLLPVCYLCCPLGLGLLRCLLVKAPCICAERGCIGSCYGRKGRDRGFDLAHLSCQAQTPDAVHPHPRLYLAILPVWRNPAWTVGEWWVCLQLAAHFPPPAVDARAGGRLRGREQPMRKLGPIELAYLCLSHRCPSGPAVTAPHPPKALDDR